MPKLKRKEFDEKYRFRDAREKGMVQCAACACVEGDESTGAYCGHAERVRRVQLAEYFRDPASSWSVAKSSVCDAFTPQPSTPELFAKAFQRQALLLNTQHRDVYHADPDCPYVIEELRLGERLASTGKEQRAGVVIIDISDLVEGQVIGAGICEMPCCNSKLNFQTWRPDTYRQRTGIKPDGTEEKKWVRRGEILHERKGGVVPSEAEHIFDLSRFASGDFEGDNWKRVHAASQYLWENCNELGSRPLSDAINPVHSSPSYHHVWESPFKNPQGNLELWLYDGRLFDWRKEIASKTPIRDLADVPEGLIPCIDTTGIFKWRDLNRYPEFSYDFKVYGVMKPVDESLGLPKGVSHFIQIGALSYNHLHNWMSGVFGKGFCGEAHGEE